MFADIMQMLHWLDAIETPPQEGNSQYKQRMKLFPEYDSAERDNTFHNFLKLDRDAAAVKTFSMVHHCGSTNTNKTNLI